MSERSDPGDAAAAPRLQPCGRLAASPPSRSRSRSSGWRADRARAARRSDRPRRHQCDAVGRPRRGRAPACPDPHRGRPALAPDRTCPRSTTGSRPIGSPTSSSRRPRARAQTCSRSGCAGEIHVTGDPLCDILESWRDRVTPGGGEYLLATVHRNYNTDDSAAAAGGARLPGRSPVDGDLPGPPADPRAHRANGGCAVPAQRRG